MVLSIALIACIGCTHLATVSHLRPATVDIREIDRLAVIDASDRTDMSPPASETLINLLLAGHCYEVLQEDALCSWPDCAPRDANGNLQMPAAAICAQRAGGDSLLVYRFSVEKSSGSGAREDALPVLLLAFQVFGVPDGRLLDSGIIRVPWHCQTDDYAWGGRRSSDRSMEGVHGSREAAALAAVTELAHRIAPYSVTEEVRLAFAPLTIRGAQVYRGNVLAKRGRWEEATQKWEAALQGESTKSAAAFNLAVAAEAGGNFARAQRYLEAADRVPRSYRQDAMKRVERASREFVVAALQQTSIVRGASPDNMPPGGGSLQPTMLAQREPVRAEPPVARRLPPVASPRSERSVQTVSFEAPAEPPK
jgi:tetratricopeptide (TPR) repeat protein